MEQFKYTQSPKIIYDSDTHKIKDVVFEYKKSEQLYNKKTKTKTDNGTSRTDNSYLNFRFWNSGVLN